MARKTLLLPIALGVLVQGCANMSPSSQYEPDDEAPTPDASISDASTADSGSTSSAEKLLFTRTIGNERHIFVAVADGTGEQQLTTQGFNFSATWSPSGERIAFARGSVSVPGFALYSMASNGNGLTGLLTWEGLRQTVQDGSHLGGLSWSPDGTNLAFHAIDLWVPSVFVMPVAENGARCPDGPGTCGPPLIIKIVHAGNEPAWSPDGQFLAFATPVGVWIAESDGSNPRELVSSRSATDPTWSPAGDVIAFSVGDAEADIFTIRPDGSDMRQVTTLSGREVHPTFSRDARTIAFSHQLGESSEILGMNLATGATTLLVQNADDPVFQP